MEEMEILKKHEKEIKDLKDEIEGLKYILIRKGIMYISDINVERFQESTGDG